MKKSILFQTWLIVTTITSMPLANSQISHEWSISDDIAEWGDFDDVNDRTVGGSYTRSFDMIKPTGPTSLIFSGSQGVNHGPYDGRSGVVGAFQRLGVYTRTDPNSVYDLSATSSSINMRFVYMPVTKFANTGGIVHLFEAGLTTNASHFGHASDDSVFVAAKLNNPYGATYSPGTYKLDLYDDNGIDQTPTDQIWTSTPTSTLENSVAFDGVGKFQSGNMALVELKWTNLGAGLMNLDYFVTNLDIASTNSFSTVTGSALTASGSQTFAHNLSNLTALRPGFGVRTNDDDIPVSAAVFDWDPAYESFVVPEPSSSALLALGALSLLSYRRRK